MKQSEAPVSGNNVMFPRTNRNLRVLEATYGLSKSSGNPMITLDCELAGNPIEEVNGKPVDLNGLKVTYYIPFTKGNAAKLFELYNRLHLPLMKDAQGEEYLPVDAECTDDHHPDPTVFENLTFNATIGCEKVIARQNPKPARTDPATGKQLPAQKVGDPILGPDGKEILQGFKPTAQFSDIFYLVDSNS